MHEINPPRRRLTQQTRALEEKTEYGIWLIVSTGESNERPADFRGGCSRVELGFPVSDHPQRQVGKEVSFGSQIQPHLARGDVPRLIALIEHSQCPFIDLGP